MSYAYTQFDPVYADSAQTMFTTTEAVYGIYVPMEGTPQLVDDYRVSLAFMKMTCLYCALRHLFDREKEKESLKALLCLGCGAPLPLPEG
jgi:hypothetical protein